MKGEKTPCIPSLVPVVQLAQPGKLLGKMVERSGALEPSRIRRDKTGIRPSLASGEMMSNVAPSSPMITVFIQSVEALRFYVESMRGSFSRQHRAAIHTFRNTQPHSMKQCRSYVCDVRLVGA